MKKRRQIWNQNARVNEINVSPLIDVVFILLIFFIVTTVFVEETGVDVQRPQASAADHLDKNSILIAITEAGKVVYGGNEIGSHGVQAVVRRLLQREPNMPVIIQADRRASVDVYTKVHDAAALAGASRIHLATAEQ